MLPEWGPPQPGDPEPELALPSLRGSVVRLSSSRGHWVLLHFTASWCPFCDAEITHFDEIATARAKDGLVAAWPAASTFDLGGETIATFEREVVARVPFDVAAGAGRGSQTVHGTLHFQACTPASCLAPATTAFEATVVVR